MVSFNKVIQHKDAFANSIKHQYKSIFFKMVINLIENFVRSNALGDNSYYLNESNGAQSDPSAEEYGTYWWFVKNIHKEFYK